MHDLKMKCCKRTRYARQREIPNSEISYSYLPTIYNHVHKKDLWRSQPPHEGIGTALRWTSFSVYFFKRKNMGELNLASEWAMADSPEIPWLMSDFQLVIGPPTNASPTMKRSWAGWPFHESGVVYQREYITFILNSNDDNNRKQER